MRTGLQAVVRKAGSTDAGFLHRFIRRRAQALWAGCLSLRSGNMDEHTVSAGQGLNPDTALE